MRRFLGTMAIALIVLPLSVFAAGTDQETAQQIAESLRASGKMKGYSIAVKYKDGTARLEGTVRSQQQLEQALELVNRTPEVKRVINNLTIEPGLATPAMPAEAAPVDSTKDNSSAPSAFRGGLFRKLAGGSEPSSSRNGDAPTAAEPASAPAARLASNNVPTPAPSTLPSIASGSARQQANLPQPMPLQGQQVPYGQPISLQNPMVMQGQPMMMQGQPMMMQGQPMMMQGQPGAMPMHPQGYMQGQPMPVSYRGGYGPAHGGPMPEYVAHTGAGTAPAVYDQPHLPNYAWPSYAAHPNYAALSYPKQYSPTAWPYIGPFYPYPQVPLGWRKVTMEWDDGWWFLNFADDRRHVGHY